MNRPIVKGTITALLSSAPGGVMLRRLLPWAIALSLVSSWLIYQSEKLGWSDSASGHRLLAVINILILSTVISRCACWLNHLADDLQLTKQQEEVLQKYKTECQQAETACKESEERYQSVVEQSGDGIYLIDIPTRRIIEANPAYLTLLGYSLEELKKLTLYDIVDVDPQILDRRITQLLHEKHIYLSASQQRRKDGSLVDITASVTLISYGGKDVFSAVVHDITEHKQTEATIKQQADRERLTAEIAQRIRRSLDLDIILNTTVAEVWQLLQADRVLIYQFHPDWSGTVVVESVSPDFIAIEGQTIHDPCFGKLSAQKYCQGAITAIADLSTANIQPCHAELLRRFQVQANLVVPILIGGSEEEGERREELGVGSQESGDKGHEKIQNSPPASPSPPSLDFSPSPLSSSPSLWGLLVAHQCAAPRPWQSWETSLLQQLATQVGIAIQQSQLYQQTQRQAQIEQALNRVVQAIRNSLDLETIFTTATVEIAHLLEISRAEIVRYLPDRQVWVVVADYHKDPGQPNAIGMELPDDNHPITVQVKHRESAYIEDSIACSVGNTCALAGIEPGSWLIVPLHFGGKLWGSLGLLKDAQFLPWEVWEEELASEAADQLAIAIQQSELYQQVQQLNTHHENLVNERTSQLQQALDCEALLKRITDRVRDSLDEQHILQTAVCELTLLAFVDSCHAQLYDLEGDSAKTSCEFSNLDCSLQDYVSQVANLPEIQTLLLQNQHFQMCSLTPHPSLGFIATFACPIMDDERVLGNLWLTKPGEHGFDQMEIRLVQQVANQCGIALRQSHLYQAAQAQVKELERLNHLKDDFLNTVSHELRTPMSSIKMAIQMLETFLLNQEKEATISSGKPESAIALQEPSILSSASLQTLQLYVQILQEECDREISLINDLLDLSRLDSGTEPLSLTSIAPQQWILHIAEPYLERAKLHHQDLQLEIPSSLPLLTTDLVSLGRILTELLNNACKYTPQGGKIFVWCQLLGSRKATSPLDSKPETLQISISNTGVEIPADELPHVFDKFYRVPNSDPWKHGGTGLGLALVKKLAEHLSSTVLVESANNRTTFTVELPLDLSK